MTAGNGHSGFDETWFWALLEGRLSTPARRAVIEAAAQNLEARRALRRVLWQAAVLLRADPAVLEEPVPERLKAVVRRALLSARRSGT